MGLRLKKSFRFFYYKLYSARIQFWNYYPFFRFIFAIFLFFACRIPLNILMLLSGAECMGSVRLIILLKLEKSLLSLKSNLVFKCRFTIGHQNGSSHGQTRIGRTADHQAYLSQLGRLSLQEYWPAMEKDLNAKLIYPNPYIFMSNVP